MTFADLFAPFPDLPTVQPCGVDRQDRTTLTLNVEGKVITREGGVKACDPIAIESRPCLSILSKTFVPLDQPFAEGQRYGLAGATEWPSRLDLFIADPAGPWLRRHGVLLATQPQTEPARVAREKLKRDDGK